MKSFAYNYFPKTKNKWKLYITTIIPMLLGSMFFALNGVVDNFMVGSINQGVAALAAINSWTNIVFSVLIATAAGGSVLLGQYIKSGNVKRIKEIVRYRYLLSYFLVTPIALVAFVYPDFLTSAFYTKSGNKLIDQEVYQAADQYARIIGIQWLLIIISFNIGNQLREIGHGKHTMIWGVGTLFTNIVLNYITIYVLKMGVRGAAIASCAGRLFAICYGLTFVIKKKLDISINPFSLFKVSKETQILFWRRWPYIISIATVNIFVTFRLTMYGMGFTGQGGIGIGVSALSVVGLAGAIMSVFTTTFSALGSMASIHVGRELGANNLKQAKINSDELKGFNTLTAFVLSLVLIGFSFAVPYLSFLSSDQMNESGELIFDSQAHLLQVQNSLFVIAVFYPIWIWFSTSYRNGNAGGKGGWFAFVDWIISGLQVLWAFIVFVYIVPTNNYMMHNFWAPYAIFFTSDLLKLVSMEFLYYKNSNWLHSITQTEEAAFQAKAQDQIAELKPE